MQFKIYLYQSTQLSNTNDSQYNDPDIALNRAETYLNGAFDSILVDHDVNVVVEDTIDVPNQTKNENFEADDPCGSYTEGYTKLIYWWRDWVDCKTPWNENDEDCVLLITDGNGGGSNLRNFYSVACHGDSLGDLPSSYDKYGSTAGYSQMQTIFHEFGHALIDYSASEEHNMGDVHTYDHDPYRTPMGHGGDTADNYCGDTIDTHTDDDEALYFDDCAQSKMEHTG